MKDCSSCENRVALHPEYRTMKWDEVPCSKCKATEPFGRNMGFDERLLYQRVRMHDPVQQERVIELLAHVFLCWVQLDPIERDILAEYVVRPDLTRSEIASIYGLSRPGLYGIYKRIAQKFPVLQTFTPYHD